MVDAGKEWKDPPGESDPIGRPVVSKRLTEGGTGIGCAGAWDGPHACWWVGVLDGQGGDAGVNTGVESSVERRNERRVLVLWP